MADQLAIFNDALAHLGERRIVSTAEAREPQRVLNDQWPLAVRWCLEIAPWSFATRFSPLAATPGAFLFTQYDNAFTKPADWVRTVDIGLDAKLLQPLTDYADEAGYWYANASTIFVRYVSSDAAWGGDPNRWPPSFVELVAARLAERCCTRIKGVDVKNTDETYANLVALRKDLEQAAIDAETVKAARVFPTGSAAATRVRIYNAALAHLGRTRIAALTEASPQVRALNDEWAIGVRWALEQGPWSFAVRTIAIGPRTERAALFGFANAFLKPDDWLKSVSVARDDRFREPFTAWIDEGGWWFSDAGTLFVRYISTAAEFGMNFARWSPAFCDLIALRLAERVCPLFEVPASKRAELVVLRKDAMKAMRGTDALNTPPVFPPAGSWLMARSRGGYRRGEQGGGSSGGPPLGAGTTLGVDTDAPIDTDFIPRN